MDKESFRKYGHEIVDWIADYFENIEDYPVKSLVKPGEIKNQLPPSAPVEGEPTEQLMDDFEKIILPGISHWQHPGWFAYFPANNSPVSVLAEMLTAGLGVQGMIWDTSPAATELEEVVMNWLRDMIGLPPSFSGVIQDTASTATLCALISARERKTNYHINEKGFQDRLRVYTSPHTHSSIEKGVKIAGFGRENLVHTEVDDEYAMDPVSLRNAIENDLKQGFIPCCVVATLGTTSSMAMDPLTQIGEICHEYGVWFHVDAAFAGTAAIAPEFRYIMEGTEKADSFVFNPHKWMLTNFDCSAFFVRNSLDLQKAFAIMPEYLKTSSDNQVNNYRDWGIQLGRRFRALKLWFVLRHYGITGIQEIIRKHVSMADTFKSWLVNDPDFEILAPANLTLICFRYIREGLNNDELNTINSNLLSRINQSGEVYLTHTVLSGKYCIRLSVATRTTEQRHLKRVYELLKMHTQ